MPVPPRRTLQARHRYFARYRADAPTPPRRGFEVPRRCLEHRPGTPESPASMLQGSSSLLEASTQYPEGSCVDTPGFLVDALSFGPVSRRSCVDALNACVAASSIGPVPREVLHRCLRGPSSRLRAPAPMLRASTETQSGSASRSSRSARYCSLPRQPFGERWHAGVIRGCAQCEPGVMSGW